MEQFNLNKLYYDKDGVKLYGHDMLRLAINKLFFRQRTLALKVFSWVLVIGAIVFYQFFFLQTYKYIDNFFYDILCICASVAAVYSVIFLVVNGSSYFIFSNSEEFKRRTQGLPIYKKAFKKMSYIEKDSLIKQAKETIMNTPSIRKDFERHHNQLTALNNAINQTTHNASQTATNMAYTGQQQIYSGFDAINFGNNNNKNNSII